VVSRLDHKQGCCTAADADDARRVAERLGIPFYALDLSDDFGRVMDYFATEYARGRTPNPCVQCNNWIKFGKLFDYADAVGAACVATGHYARVEPRGGEPALLRGIDPSKDQSYALAGIRRAMLTRMLLPVGSHEKASIRAMAAAIGLRVADKKDSQEICFVTQGRYDEFVKRRLAPDTDRSGDLVTTSGEVVGRHDGIEGFTVGQRKGLGVALGKPAFVVKIEPDTRRVVLGERDELLCDRLTAAGVNWLVDPPPAGTPLRCWAQVRYNSQASEATATVAPDGGLVVAFDEPATSVTPGQAVVLYELGDPDRALAAGWID
jgi:tRNA-specific 2-thiouridylase